MISFFKRYFQQKVLTALAADLNNPKSEVSKRVNDKAGVIAGMYVMNWLNQKGIRHCLLCPSTDQLRRSDTNFFCPAHYSAKTESIAPEKTSV